MMLFCLAKEFGVEGERKVVVVPVRNSPLVLIIATRQNTPWKAWEVGGVSRPRLDDRDLRNRCLRHMGPQPLSVCIILQQHHFIPAIHT